MPEYLTPAEVEEWANGVEFAPLAYADTLREMAAVVKTVADKEPLRYRVCVYCGLNVWDYGHAPDCIYLRARKLMGHAE